MVGFDVDEPDARVPVAWAMNLFAAFLSRRSFGPVGMLLGYDVGGVKATCFWLVVRFPRFVGTPDPSPFNAPRGLLGVPLLP